MMISQWLAEATKKLAELDIATARLDAEVLLADALEKDRGWLLAHLDDELASERVKELAAKIQRREKHEPLAYIRGKQEFYGRDFIVSPDTLTPRPETETMLELACEWASKRASEKLQILDIGTGSGCIAITAALELSKIPNLKPNVSVYATEINERALKIARKNAHALRADVEFLRLDLLQPGSHTHLLAHSQLVLANLPYVPDNFQINLAAAREPRVAIFGGKDGLDLYREMFSQLADRNSPVAIFTESLPPQHEVLRAIAKSSGFMQTDEQDFIQVFECT